jgi:hypothetical protein
MVATFTESTGREWGVAEAFRVGAGACGEGDVYPEATHITIRFESRGETRWASNVPDDWHRPERLPELFQQSTR